MVWPTAEQEWVLRFALGSPTDRRPAGDLDVRRLDDTTRRLLPLLYPKLRDLDVRGPLRDASEQEYRQTASRNAALFDRGRRLVDELQKAGVVTLTLKGAALVARYYGDAGLRPMADMDVAIPIASLFPSIAALHRAGWTPRYRLTTGFIRTRHAAPFATADGFACDLHWRIFAEPTPPGFEDELWTMSSEIDFHGVRTRALSSADQLVHVCLHGARWAPVPAVWWIGDAATIVHAGDVDWNGVVSRAVNARFVLRLREALGYLHDRLDVAIPPTVLDDLRARRVSAFERLEWRLLAREHRMLGELPTYWCHHRRSGEGGGLQGVLGFPAYLRDAWGLRSPADLPRAATSRAVVRVRDALRRLGGVT